MARPGDWDMFLGAIRAQESGNDYTHSAPGCYGAYCWNAQPNWDDDARAAGLHQYVGKNPASLPPRVQDEVASRNLYRIYQRSGGGAKGLEAAARWWNGGSTANESNPGLPAQPWAPHCGGGDTQAYACQILRRMALGGHYVAGRGSGGVVLTSDPVSSDCAIALPSFKVAIFWGQGPTVGGSCLLSKSEVRAIASVGIAGAGAMITLYGIALLTGQTKAARTVLTVVAGVPARALRRGQASPNTAPPPATVQTSGGRVPSSQPPAGP